jgi:RNAse (barnase) inhibitor barstar
MAGDVTEFRFSESPLSEARPGDRVVHFKAGLRRKRRLLGVLARGLAFPDWFGWNWDALWDCLTEAADHDPPIVLVHDGVPFVPGSNARRTYLEILRDAVRESKRLTVVFPVEAKPEVAAALSASDA